MRVFLAGATGVIGRGLMKLLVQDGHEVVGMTRSPERAQRVRQAGGEAVVCDALDAAALREAVVAARPEALIHELTDIPPRLEPRRFKTQLAATNRLRREGTRNLLAAAQDAGVQRLVAQSVAFVYSPTGGWIKDESAPLALDAPAPLDEVVRAVADLERQVREFGGIVLRYGFFYGPGTAFSPDGFYAELARKRRLPVLGSGAGITSFIQVEDAARATVMALERSAAAVFNIVDDDPAPARDWVPAYAQAVGGPSPLRLPAWIGRLAAGRAAVASMTTQRGASNVKAKAELGWQPSHPSWRQGLAT
jgi:nucleoside-diphosphate-sugar epimerase